MLIADCMPVQEYFFPKREEREEGTAGTKRQQTWVRSVDAKLKSRKSAQGAGFASADGVAAAADLAPPDLAAVRLGRPDIGGSKSAVTTPHVPSASGAILGRMEFSHLALLSLYC